MQEIAEMADLVLVDGKAFLLAPVTDATIEALATFEAAREDIEETRGQVPGPGGRFYDATKIDTAKGERWFCS